MDNPFFIVGILLFSLLIFIKFDEIGKDIKDIKTFMISKEKLDNKSHENEEP